MKQRLFAALTALTSILMPVAGAWAQGAGAQTLTTLTSAYRIPVIAGAATVNQETTLGTLAAFIGGGGGGSATQLVLNGTTSGAVTMKPQAVAGTFNFNLPITAGASGDLLRSGGGGSAAMSWLTPGTGVATWLATPSSANLLAALTDETGTGAAVFGTSPTLAGATLTTPTLTTPVLGGHPAVLSNPPALTSCGTSPAIAGSDVAGEVTMGTDTPTGCVITFATAYTSAPFCVVSWQDNLASMIYAVSTTAITLTQTATSSNKVDYHCLARAGG